MRELYLNPIYIKGDPQHTQIEIQCLKCDKREVCSIQSDYRKTVTLIQNILGAPNLDREILFCDTGFTGFEFQDITIFPTTYAVKPLNKDATEANFLNARFSSKNTVKFLLKVDEYYVLFIFKYDESFDKYIPDIGRELLYGIPFEMEEESIESLQAPLIEWRRERIEWEKELKEKDIINTTNFYCQLRCKQFSPKRREGIRNPHEFTNNNCCEDADYKHIATYHIEDDKVEEAHHCNLPPIGVYPWFIPAPAPCPPKRPPVKRGDQ